jgi:hypothetical protein
MHIFLANTRLEPVGAWAYEVINWGAWLACFVVLLVKSVRQRKVDLWFLLLFVFTTLWWQDTFGAWGGYFLYNPRFALISWWQHSTWTSPNKPWFIIPAYGNWWTIAIGLSFVVMQRVRARYPSWSLAKSFLLTMAPFFYAWDLILETLFVHLHFQDYTMPVGPSINTSDGHFPLIWPLLPQIAWIFSVVWLVTWKDKQGRRRFEVLTRVHPLAGVRGAFARLGVYTVAINVSYAVILIIPMMLVRAVYGEPSVLVP